MARDRKARKASWPIKVPRDWRSTKRSGALISDTFLPILFIALTLLTLGLISILVAIVAGIVPYQ